MKLRNLTWKLQTIDRCIKYRLYVSQTFVAVKVRSEVCSRVVVEDSAVQCAVKIHGYVINDYGKLLFKLIET
jgi:hypothetical protein